MQEKLDDASINLPELYKRIEKQAPENCTTEAWKKRTHWAGLIPTPEATEVVKIAEKELTVQRPVRRSDFMVFLSQFSCLLFAKVQLFGCYLLLKKFYLICLESISSFCSATLEPDK